MHTVTIISRSTLLKLHGMFIRPVLKLHPSVFIAVSMVTLIQKYSFDGDGSNTKLVKQIAMVTDYCLVQRSHSSMEAFVLHQGSIATTAASLASLGAILKQANEHPNFKSELNSSNKVAITSSRRCGLHRLM